ncbi:MAG: ribonuclease E/G [Rhodospirillales bacterium]
MAELVVNHQPGETRVARLIETPAGPRAASLTFHRSGFAAEAGDIRLGRFRRFVPGIKGAFVHIGDAVDAFLPINTAAGRTFSEGDAIIVQLRNPAYEDKGARLTAAPRLGGFFVSLLATGGGIKVSRGLASSDRDALLARFGDALSALAPDSGFLLRRRALTADPALVREEAERLVARWTGIQALAAKADPGPVEADGAGATFSLLADLCGPDRDTITLDDADLAGALKRCLGGELAVTFEVPATGLFRARGLEDELLAALQPEVPLAGGGSLMIEQTRALTVVDVNTGGASAKGADAALATNHEAMAELVFQMGLRNLAGLVVVDPVSLKKASARRAVIESLHQALQRAGLEAQVGGYTALGLLELNRERRGPRLAEAATGSVAEAFNWLRAALARGQEPGAARRPCLALDADLKAVVDGPAAAFRRAIEARLGLALAVEATEKGRSRLDEG